jgi:hypothetical protein
MDAQVGMLQVDHEALKSLTRQPNNNRDMSSSMRLVEDPTLVGL